MITRLALRGLSVTAAAALAACAGRSAAPPEDPFKTADSSIEQAEYSRASDYASPEMHSAREKLRDARQLSQKADQDKNPQEKRQAEWLAQEAAADADLAAARAEDARAQNALRQQQAAPPPAQPAPGGQP